MKRLNQLILSASSAATGLALSAGSVMAATLKDVDISQEPASPLVLAA
jgi:hypothetical protein